MFIDGDITIQQNAYIPITTIGDNKWHYICVDIYQGLLNNWGTNSTVYPTYRLTLISVK